jgi:hypothetical protein
MRLLAAVAFFVALFGCAGTYTPPSPTHSVLMGCTAYTSALNSLAVRRKAGLLNAQEIARVDELRAIVNPICTADRPPEGSAGIIDPILLELEAMLARSAAGERS